MKTIIMAAGAVLAVSFLGLSRGTEGSDVDASTSTTTPTEAQNSYSVVGGKHDFTDVTGSPGSACNPCHIPHVQAVRPTSQPTTQPSVELFRIVGQRRVFEPGRYTPGPTSLICLGCHDGTVATSTIGSAHAILAGAREGFDIPEGFGWRDHPIGVPYPKDRREYHPEPFVTAKGQVRLPEGRIECISCHDPHGTSGVDKMLVMSNRRSALCLTCHIK